MIDQVVTDMRLWLRSAISTLTDNALQLITTMVERAAAWDKHTLAYVNMCSAVTLQFLKNDIFHHFFWNSEKLKSFFLVTPTCRGHSQSDGATGFWGDLPVLTYLHFSHLSYKTVWCSRQSRASLSPATLLPSAEMWSGFRSSRKELTFYLSAGTPWTRSCVTFILVSQIW